MGHHCIWCREVFGEDYMVQNAVWQEAKAYGYVHIRCLEKMLGRKLQITDFTDAPCNDGIRFGFKLGESNA
jgi:hypothetical protein